MNMGNMGGSNTGFQSPSQSSGNNDIKIKNGNTNIDGDKTCTTSNGVKTCIDMSGNDMKVTTSTGSTWLGISKAAAIAVLATYIYN